MFLAEVQLTVEELVCLALKVVTRRGPRKVAAVSVWVVQEEFHRSFTMGEGTVLISIQEVDLAESPPLLIDDLAPNVDELDLTDMSKPVVQKMFEIASNAMFPAFCEKRRQMVVVDRIRVELKCWRCERIVDQ